MAQYYPLVANAVAALEKNTGEGRRLLYERARTALVAQLRNMKDPPLNEAEITRERLALEETIRRVEGEAARTSRYVPKPIEKEQPNSIAEDNPFTDSMKGLFSPSIKPQDDGRAIPGWSARPSQFKAPGAVQKATDASNSARRAQLASSTNSHLEGAEGILISYRRDDSAAITHRLADRLIDRYGDARIYLDIDVIPLGVDFRTYIRDLLGRSSLVLVIIGRDWAGKLGNRPSRIMDPNDPVRVEVEIALQRKLPLIPVLVEGGSMPRVDEVLPSLQALLTINAGFLQTGREFGTQVTRLVRDIDKYVRVHPSV